MHQRVAEPHVVVDEKDVTAVLLVEVEVGKQSSRNRLCTYGAEQVAP
jgi:hypothetical protein